MSFRDFDQRMDQMRRARRRGLRVVLTGVLMMWLGVAVAILWALKHPDVIGDYLGRIIAAARGEA